MPSSEKSEKTTQGKKAEKEAKQASPLDSLKQAYFAVEDRYYEMMDYLEDKVRVPVYEYFVEPIEKNGVPSFPIGVLLILLVGLGVFMVATGGSQTGEVSISLISAAGKAIDGATVTLYLGDSAEGEVVGNARSINGKATFSGVPLGKPLYVTVSAANFKAYGDSLGEVTADTPTIKISLDEEEVQPSVYRLTIVDEDGLPVAGAMVKAKSLAGVQVGVYNTDAKGIAKIQLPSTDSLLVTVTRTGFSNITDFGIDPKVGLLQTVTLKKPGNECANGACDKKTTVIVKVINAQQQLVQAQVLLTSSLGSILGTASTSGGQAALANIPIGTKAIISVSPSGADIGKYDTYYYYDYVVASDDNVVTVTMAPSSASGLSPVFISVADEAGRPLAADVSLYSERSDILIGKSIARSGEANFSTDNISSYVTVYAAGYLPKAVSGLRPGSREKLVLKKILAGSVGSIAVQVVDADGTTPVAQASLTIRTSDGRNAGYPAVRTNADGKATIGNVSLGVDYKVYADKSPKSGRSAIYRASEDEATKVTIKLDPTTAKVVVSTRDAVNDTGLAATVVAYGPGMSNTSCATSYSNSYVCELTVRAESTVFITASASYYETTTSPAMVLSTGDTKAYTTYLLASSLKDQFFVKFAGLFDENGKNVTLVDKGMQYDAKFIINIPTGSSTSKTGLMVRAGTVGKESVAATDSKEKFAILSDGTTKTSTDPIFASTYVPSTSCSNDRKSNSELGYFKWVSFAFSGESGSREITVRLLSKIDAASTDKLQINYNGWYSAGGSSADTYLRTPADSDFGSALRSPTRDYCYAKSTSQVFTVASGRSTCTSSACISLDFSDGTADYGSSYLGAVNTPMIAKVEVRLLKAVASPRLFVSSDNGNMQITHYSITTDAESKELDSTAKAISNVTIQMLPFSDPASVRFNLLPVVPVSSGVFTMRFYEGQTELVSAKGYVTLTGEGKMKIVYVKPDRINASEYTDLAVKVADANSGSAITDATLSINETSGKPFDGSVPEPMTGSSLFSSGQGYNGIYTFSDVSPSANGIFEVIAEHPDYATVRQNVTVNTDDFLTVTPINLEVCGKTDERSIKVLNNLPLNVSIVATSSCAIMSSYVYSQTAYDSMSVPTAYYNATSFVAYDSFSQSYKFTLPESRLGVFTVRPAAYGKTCSIVFNAEGKDKSKDVQTVKYSTCASDSADKFLSVTPSKVICTSDEGNCNTASTITISNNLSTDVDGVVTVTIKGASLVLDSSASTLAGAKTGASLSGTGLAAGRTISFDDAKTSLDSGYTFEMARGASIDLSIIPAAINKTLQLVVNAIAGTRKAVAAVEIKNCPGAIDTVGPTIVSSYPTSGSTIDYTPFKILITTDKAAVCTLDSLYTLTSSSGDQVHTMEMSLNAGSDSPALKTGQNIYSAKCCNLAENGGKCGTATTISFKYEAESEDKLANGEDCDTDDECESGYCNSKGVCADESGGSGSDLCGPYGIACSSSCGSPIGLGSSCKSYLKDCCASGLECGSDNTCIEKTSKTLGMACSYTKQNCDNPFYCGQVPATTGNTGDLDRCTCNWKSTSTGATVGCPTSQPNCVEVISGSQYGTCVSDKIKSTPPKECSKCVICSDSGSCIQPSTSSGTQTGTTCTNTCTAPKVHASDCSCVDPQTQPGTTPSGIGNKFFKYSFSSGKLTDESGAEVSTTAPIVVSSIFPISGFFVQMVNDMGTDSNIELTIDKGGSEIYLVSGTSISPVTTSLQFAKTDTVKTKTLFVAYNGSSLYSAAAGKLAFANGAISAQTVKFTVGTTPKKDLQMNLQVSVAPTDKYAFSAGLFDKNSAMFVPYVYADDGKATATLDGNYVNPSLVKTSSGSFDFEYKMFNNIQFGGNTGSVKTKPITPTKTDGSFEFPQTAVTAEVLSTLKADVSLNSAALNVLGAVKTSGSALTHAEMASELTAAVKEQYALEQVASKVGVASDLFAKIGVRYGATASGANTAPAAGNPGITNAPATGKTASFAECNNGDQRFCDKDGNCYSKVICTENSGTVKINGKCVALDPSVSSCKSPYTYYATFKGTTPVSEIGCYWLQTCASSAWPTSASVDTGLPANPLAPSGSQQATSGSTVAVTPVSGSFPDIYVAAIEGGTLRVLRFTYSSGTYGEPTDITSNYEYPVGENRDKVQVGDKAYSLFAYPGQKFNTAVGSGATATASVPSGTSTISSGTFYNLVYWIWPFSGHAFTVGGSDYGLYGYEGPVNEEESGKWVRLYEYPSAHYAQYKFNALGRDGASVSYGAFGTDAKFEKCTVVKATATTSYDERCEAMGSADVKTLLGAAAGSSTLPGTPGDAQALPASGVCSDYGKCKADGSDSYCNPSSKKTESNPRLCCASGLSQGGNCVPTGPQGGAYSLPGLVQYVSSFGRFAESIADIKKEGSAKLGIVSNDVLASTDGSCTVRTFSSLSSIVGCGSGTGNDGSCARAFYGITCEKFDCDSTQSSDASLLYWALNDPQLKKYSVEAGNGNCQSKSGIADLGPVLMPKLSQVNPTPVTVASTAAAPTASGSSLTGGATGNTLSPFGSSSASDSYYCAYGSSTSCSDIYGGGFSCLYKFSEAYSGVPTTSTEKAKFMCMQSSSSYSGQCSACDSHQTACVSEGGTFRCAAFCKVGADCASGYYCTRPLNHPDVNAYGVCLKSSSGASVTPGLTACPSGTYYDTNGRCVAPFVYNTETKTCPTNGEYNSLTGKCACNADPSDGDSRNGCPFRLDTDSSATALNSEGKYINHDFDCIIMQEVGVRKCYKAAPTATTGSSDFCEALYQAGLKSSSESGYRSDGVICRDPRAVCVYGNTLADTTCYVPECWSSWDCHPETDGSSSLKDTQICKAGKCVPRPTK